MNILFLKTWQCFSCKEQYTYTFPIDCLLGSKLDGLIRCAGLYMCVMRFTLLVTRQITFLCISDSMWVLNENQGLLNMKMRQITWQQISLVVIENYPNLMTNFHLNQSRTEWPASYYSFYVPCVRNHFVWRNLTRLTHNKPSASVPCTSVPD